jgi:hypothetical protein
MRLRLLAFTIALAMAAPATAQTRIDLSSPDSVMSGLQDLAGRWTHRQFVELLRAAILVRLPDYAEDPGSFQRGRNRWALQVEGVALAMGALMEVPLILEGDSFIELSGSDKLAPWLHQILRQALEGRTLEALIDLGRSRERVILTRLQEHYEDLSPELQRQIEGARAVQSRPDPSAQDRRTLARLERRLARVPEVMDHLDRRLHVLDGAGQFAPGTVECSLEEGIDLSIEQAMMADLETLADTCPQRSLIGFLRAAAILSEVPAGLAEPGARMHPAAIREVKQNLVSAAYTIARLSALLWEEPFFPRADDAPGRLARILGSALTGRTVSEVLHEGPRAERAFLVALRVDLSQRLQTEMRASEQATAASKPPSPRIRRLRADIERIDRRLSDPRLGDGSVH